MGINIDLKPLTEETIKQMGYSSHDLWLVKIDSIVFGPFETESLKHYVSDNEALFERAEACLSDETEWKPFWEHTKFQSKKMQVVSEDYEGPFWIMDFGLKLGPYTYREIDKKIEMGLLLMTDYISIDNGENWIKIYQIGGLDRRIFSPEVLPEAPYESKMQNPTFPDNRHEKTAIEELANLAFIGHQQEIESQLKMDELTLKREIHSHRQSAVRWFIPLTAALAMALVSGIYSMISSVKIPELSAERKEEKEEKVKRERPRVPASTIPTPEIQPEKKYRASMPNPDFRPERAPYEEAPQENEPESRYQTRIETHEDVAKDFGNEYIEEPYEQEKIRPEENSLVDNNEIREDMPLDSAMDSAPVPATRRKGRIPAEEMPMVEEASDF